jgi:ubiquinone/menaquinone biosynthesis C-methylase UbiE
MSEWNKKLRTMRRYDLTAHIYDMRYSEEQTAKIHAALESISMKKHSIVLDAGCGTGLLFNHVAEKAETIVGLDISKKILLQAKERSRKFANVHLIWADADNLPFNEVFSHVFAMTIIQNMPNPAKTLKEIKRTTKNDAVIVVTGLKKKFSLEAFVRLLRKTGLSKFEIKDENLKCYVAICFKVTVCKARAPRDRIKA